MYGFFSSLLMNAEKPVLIWIGGKRLWKENLEVGKRYCCDCNIFGILRLEYSVNLKLVVSHNFAKCLHDIENILHVWNVES